MKGETIEISRYDMKVFIRIIFFLSVIVLLESCDSKAATSNKPVALQAQLPSDVMNDLGQ